MGCDWIKAVAVCLGYSISFDQVFRGTRFKTLEKFYYEDDFDEMLYNELSEEEEEDDKKHEELYNRENPHKVLRSAWTDFLTKKHPELLATSRKIQVIIGCTSKPGAYESTAYTHSCQVVFGYDVSKCPTTDEDNVVICEIPTTFPVGIPTVIKDFLSVFQKQNQDSDDEEPKKKTIKREYSINGPGMVAFLA